MKKTYTKIQKYPFSVRKHQHDLEYFRNWCFNNRDNPHFSAEKQAHVESCYETTTALLLTIQDNIDRRTGVSYLTGDEYAVAKSIIAWADGKRTAINAYKRS